MRPTISVETLPPVSPFAASEYLTRDTYTIWVGNPPTNATTGCLVSIGAATPDMRRNPGVTGDGWQLRRFNPTDPATATAICLAEGEKDAAILAAAGLIAFTAPKGAQSLPLADCTELVKLAKDKGLPVLLCGDNDEVGREAMRKVRRLLKQDFHLDATNLIGPEKGSVADFPAADLQALIRIKLSDRDPSWQKPIRNRAQYLPIQMSTS